MMIVILYVLLFFVGLGSPEEFGWLVPEAYWDISTEATLGGHPRYEGMYYNFWVNFSSPNSDVAASWGDGNFRLQVDASFGVAYSGLSRCFAMGEKRDAVRIDMRNMELLPVSGAGDGTTFAAMGISIEVDTGGRGYDKTSGMYLKQYKFMWSDAASLTAPVTALVRYDGCANISMVGDWDDASRWSLGRVPNATDTVVIPSGAGLIRLPSRVRENSSDPYSTVVQRLDLNGGELIGHHTGCPPGWSVMPSSYPAQKKIGTKCFKLFSNLTSFSAAEQTCRDQGVGALGAHLAQMESYEEVQVVKDICRGDGFGGPVDSAGSLGCWVGMRDTYGTGDYKWEEPKAMIDRSLGYLATRTLPLNRNMVIRRRRSLETPAGSAIGAAFRDWKRGGNEPNNRSVSDPVGSQTFGTPAYGGERCVYMTTHEGNPWSFEEGAFADVSCALHKPFVCQIFENSHRVELLVTDEVHVVKGGLIGGVLRTQGKAIIDDMFLSGSAVLNLDTAAGGLESSIHRLEMSDGSALDVGGALTMNTAHGHIGEVGDTHGLVPVITLRDDTTVTIGAGDVVWNARIEAGVNSWLKLPTTSSSVALNRGGRMERGSLSLTGADSEVRLGGGAMQLQTWDAFDVYVAHRSEVLGEYPEFSNYTTDIAALDGTEAADSNGVYRLKVTRAGTTEITQCIPYHASEEVMKARLDELSNVQARGNVTVRRTGSGNAALFRFGYKWRIDFDTSDTSEYSKEFSLDLACQGISGCNCSWPTVATKDPTGQHTCPKMIQGSLVDPTRCAMPPIDLRVESLTQLNHLTTTPGDPGRILVTGGVHRMPPVCHVMVAATSGQIMVQANKMAWEGLRMENDATALLFGISWSGWDSAIVLYMPPWAQTQYFAVLQTAPSFDMQMRYLSCSNMSQLLSATPKSTITVEEAVWNGGVIGGRALMTVMDKMTMDVSGKALRDDFTLFIDRAARLLWKGGNVYMTNGADVYIEGVMEASSLTGVTPFFGSAELFTGTLTDDRELLRRQPVQLWDGYYDANVPRNLRDGWFATPICGDGCSAVSEVRIRGDGVVNVIENARAHFAVPMNFIDDSRFNLRDDCVTSLESGGTFGNQVVVEMYAGSSLSLTGGELKMGETSQIRGLGDLFVVDGTHDVASVVFAKITIQGGKLVWPLAAGDGRLLVFEAGLVIEQEGTLEVQPWSTEIEVKKEVMFKDDCLLQFPMIGISSQPLASDRQAQIELEAEYHGYEDLTDRLDATDPAKPGRLIARDKMTFLGGTLRGKARFESFGTLTLDGTEKRVRSLAKLINRGMAIWGDGDIITADQGDFLNFGTLQTKEAETNTTFRNGVYYEGTVIPIENGGDRYAINFHTWDVDEGQLDFSQYIEERKNYVSRAPPGWTKEWQNGLLVETVVDGHTRTDGSGSDNPITKLYAPQIPDSDMTPFFDELCERDVNNELRCPQRVLLRSATPSSTPSGQPTSEPTM